MLVVSTLRNRAKTEIDVGLTKIEVFGRSLLMATIPSTSEVFFPPLQRLLHSYPIVSPRSECVKDRLVLGEIAADFRCAAKFGYLLYISLSCTKLSLFTNPTDMVQGRGRRLIA